MDAFTSWATHLTRRGYRVLPSSHPVPVELWAVPPGDPSALLHLRARGTRVVLRRYTGSDLATLVLRSECDCEEHRTAGAGSRAVLLPGAVPTAEVVYDGAVREGWRSHEAGLLGVAAVAAIFEDLQDRLPAAPADLPGPGTAVA